MIRFKSKQAVLTLNLPTNKLTALDKMIKTNCPHLSSSLGTAEREQNTQAPLDYSPLLPTHLSSTPTGRGLVTGQKCQADLYPCPLPASKKLVLQVEKCGLPSIGPTQHRQV